MNTLTQISTSMDNLYIQWMVNDMLNPSNKDLYIGNLSLKKVEKFFNAMPKYDSVATVFWSAYHIAEKKYLNSIQLPVEHSDDECPECGCKNCIQGIPCPNCEYQGVSYEI